MQIDNVNTTSGGAIKTALARGRPEASLEIPVERVLLEAHRLRDLLAANRDPLYGYDPISGPRRSRGAWRSGLLDFDPRHERYVENLEALKTQYPNCQIEDNIELEIAKATPDLAQRVARLRTCLDRFPDRDAAPEALFRLGIARRANDRLNESEDAFMRLVREHPRSIWTRQAAHYSPVVLHSRVTKVGR